MRRVWVSLQTYYPPSGILFIPRERRLFLRLGRAAGETGSSSCCSGGGAAGNCCEWFSSRDICRRCSLSFSVQTAVSKVHNTTRRTSRASQTRVHLGRGTHILSMWKSGRVKFCGASRGSFQGSVLPIASDGGANFETPPPKYRVK